MFILPEIDRRTGYLPPGVHPASWEEVRLRFGTNRLRRELHMGSERALINPAGAGCKSVFLNGSFVSDKISPADYDAAWEPSGVDIKRLDPVVLDFNNGRKAMKEKFKGDLFPSTSTTVRGNTFREFFQTDRDGATKGIVEIYPRTLL